MGHRLVRFAVTPPPKRASSTEPFAGQLSVARVHPYLVALERTVGGYAPPRDALRGWFDLPAKRGFAGYGLARALRMLLDALSGISALEDTRTRAGQPFVHGELVPALLRVDPAGRTRLIPLAPWHWSGPGTLPAPERCGHLAPERLLGDAIDARADVFSAGVLLWEALAGGRLFETDTVDSIVTRLMGEKVTLPQLPPELTWAVPLKAVAMCALSVDPDQRFANCAEMAEAIAAVAGDRLATHAEVADFFGVPDPVTRPTIGARPPRVPAHHSSLSALVAPVGLPSMPAEPAEPAKPAELGTPARVSETPVPTARGWSRPVLALAVVSCFASALGVRALARSHGRDDSQRAALSAPLRAEPIPVLPSPPSVAQAAVSAPAPVLASKPAPSSAATPNEPTAPTDAQRDEAAKPAKASPPAKAATPKLRLPTKTLRTPAAAAKYGI